MLRGNKAPSGNHRWYCRSYNHTRVYCFSTTNPEGKCALTRSGKVQSKKPTGTPQFRRALGGVDRFVITAAQNATPLHKEFFEALKQYCEFNQAELVIIPIRYKNPTSRWTVSQQNAEIWLSELTEDERNRYLYNQRKKLNANLVLLGDIKTRPTADKPLTGFEGITHGESGILGHTKMQLTTIATPQGRYPKILTTTGAVTVANYTDSKEGKKGEFHHTLGACVVDIKGKAFHMRQINADKDGSFIDLGGEYRPEGVYHAPPALGVAFGDTHRKFMDPTVEQTTFGANGIVESLNPEYLIFHDIHDAYAENPHHRGNPFNSIAKMRSGFGDVRKEVLEDIEWLKKVVADRKAVLVDSNHDDMLSRWIVNNDWRTDPGNADFYLETALAMVRGTEMTKHGTQYPDPFTYWVDKLKGEVNIKCLEPGESFMLGDIEMGLHGDVGPNGARGSRSNLRRIGVKTMIGHSHSPGIDEGAMQLGTSTPLRLEYNASGPSSWMNTHGVVYSNSKRTLINVIDGEWRF